MRAALGCLVLGLTVQSAWAGERAKTPSDAVVLIRQIGSVRVEIENLGQRRTFERERMDVGVGSGFVISPDGYVLTNEHVVGPTDVVINEGFNRGKMTVTPSRIEVCFARETVAARGGANACYEATVHASDSARDLAVLYVSASNLPYIALGDSNVAANGQRVEALGFPFGRLLEIASADRSDVVPDLTTSRGTVSALRTDRAGERRHLQVSTPVNPGNSGGPLLDEDGFALGVIQARLRDAPEVAFAIPVDQVKDFLEERGLDHLAPVRRIRQAAVHSLGAKGISLPMPEGFTDTSPFRSRVEARLQTAEIALRIDRVLSPRTLKELEQQLTATQSFESSSWNATASRSNSRRGTTTLLGRASGSLTDAEVRMVYAIVDLGREKLLARFVGPIEQIAFNEGVLRTALSDLEGTALISGEVPAATQLRWSMATTDDGQPLVSYPTEWIVEPGAPTTCQGLGSPEAQSAFIPVEDFTLGLRVAVWTRSDVDPANAATACSSRRGTLGAASYVSRLEWLGVSYSIEGVFVRVGPRVLQMEVLSVQPKELPARALLAEWVKRSSELRK